MFKRVLQEALVILAEDPQWVHPGVDGDERDEIKMHSSHLGIPHEKLRSAVAAGQVAPLHPEHWGSLQNTDSNQLRGKRHAKQLAATYGRNLQRIFKGFRKGKTMPAPIVLHRKGQDPYLIGGNTRLMAAKAAGIQPHVVHAHLDDE
jgi:hypothetical protein